MSSKPQIIDAHTLQKVIGLLAFLLPIVIVLASWLISDLTGFQDSISDYYHTISRNYFVGTLCAVGVCLIAYKGYEMKDNIAGDIAAVLVILTAFLPTDHGGGGKTIIGILHLVFAGSFFLVLIYFSLILFVKGSTEPTQQKIYRNRIYRICGYVMLFCISTIAISFVIPALKNALEPYQYIFWLETISLFAFGISWLTKGEIILKDKKPISYS